MPTKLLVVESPGKIKKLRQILGSDWLIKASVGHIRELANDGEDSLGFDLHENSVNCRFIPRGSRGADVIKDLKTAAKQVKTVVLATDPDREGETIAWHIQQALGLKNPQRVVYTEITPAAVQAAIAKPRTLDMNLVHSGLCRSVLDKLVGYRGSPLLWQLHNGAKSMGRVQSATLHILCQREREIQAFVPQDYWSVFVDYAEGFRAYYHGQVGDRPATDATEAADDAIGQAEEKTPESKRVITETEANQLVAIAQQHPHKVITVEGKRVNRTPPPPFITSSLQQAAGSRLRFSPERTMKLAQTLYEAGLITYMRTDSTELSPEFCAQARQWLTTNDPENVPQRATRHRKVKGAQEAHEAIRPTDIYRASKDLRVELEKDAFDLYVLIWKRAIASQCQAARVRQTKIITQSGAVYWQAKGQTLEFAGYTKYWNNLSADTELPTVQQGQALTLEQAAHEQKQTKPPARYTEPKLVQVMERKGIGRPSTYAPTIQTLKQRSYVEITKGSLQPTGLGLAVDDFLQDALPDLLETEFTAQMEATLDQIAEGGEDWERYLTSWNQQYFAPALINAKQAILKHLGKSAPIASQEKTYKKTNTQCPHCQKPMSQIPSQKVKKKYFLKCVEGCQTVMFWSDWKHQWEVPEPKTNASLALEKTQTLTNYPCPVCKKPMEEHAYQKDGLPKKMLRCSDIKARNQPKHKEAVYFLTAKGWWSPKYDLLTPCNPPSPV